MNLISKNQVVPQVQYNSSLINIIDLIDLIMLIMWAVISRVKYSAFN